MPTCVGMSMEHSKWRSFMRKHWRMATVFALGAALVLWTMSHLVTFIVYAVLWELLLVGIPIAIAAVAGWQWWKRLPEPERKFHFAGRKRSTGGGGGSLLLFIAFCIKVFIDGRWNVPIATFTLDYIVGSMI